MAEATAQQAPFVQNMTESWKVRSCARCDHRSDQHLWNGTGILDVKPPIPCMVEGCTCESWTFEPKRG